MDRHDKSTGSLKPNNILQENYNLPADIQHLSDLPPRPSSLSIGEASIQIKKKHGSTNLKRQPRIENASPRRVGLELDEMEKMRQETKLFVLEYLSSLPPEQIQARNKKRSSSAIRTKAKTIHASERPFNDMIEKRRHANLKRRNSEQYDQQVREKLLSMAYPLKKNISPEVLSDIARFDKTALRGTVPCKKGQHLALLSLAKPEHEQFLDSPLTCVTLRLEEMSEDIMKDYPRLLDEHLSELLTPLDSGEKLTYEDFSVVAKSVFEKQLARVTGSIWTKVAMVFYLVKEVIFSGGLNDIQVELLVDYATRFIAEYSLDPIKKEGGWVALDIQDNSLLPPTEFRGDIYNPLGDSVDSDTVDGRLTSISKRRDNSVEDEVATFSYFGAVNEVVKTWTTYGAAALAVGIGVAYSYLKQQ